jgi:hypothetical protein
MTASEMAIKRWSTIPPGERSRLARKANRARNRSLIKRERKALAQHAAQIRWYRYRAENEGIDPNGERTAELTL